MSRSSLRRVSPLLLLLLWSPLCGSARAETVHTKDGQTLQGEVVEETLDELVLKTRYGVLVLPTSAIESIDGRPGAAAEAGPAAPEAPPLDLARLGVLHLKARRQAQLGKPQEALATYAELLGIDPDDAAGHLELGLLHAQLGRTAEAVGSLRRAILGGFADLERLRRDPDLVRLQKDPSFTQLMAQKAGLLALAGRRTPDRLIRELRAKGAKADYRVVRDDPRKLVYLHALEPAAFPAARADVEALVGALRRDLFTGQPAGPLFLVLVARSDRGVLGRDSARYDVDTNTLLLAPFPFGALARAPGARRELVRALHACDQQARQQRHPAWLEEGLAEVFGAAALQDEHLVPRSSALVEQLQKTLSKQEPGAAPWGGLLDLDRAGFEKRPLARLTARSLLQWLLGRGELTRFYEQYTSGRETSPPGPLEAALGQPPADAEQAWRAWVAEQTVPELPFTGLLATGTARGLRVSYVQAESGAARANLVEGDVLYAVDGVAVRNQDDLNELLAGCAIGQAIEVDLLRGEEPLRVQLTLAARPAGPIGPLRDKAPYLGIAVEEANGGGVAIRSVDKDSPAAKADLRPGDELLSLDGAEVESVRGWLRALRVKQAGQRAVLIVQRAGQKVTVEVELAPLE